MSALKLEQLQYETETWKRLLIFMTEENIHLKNRLSEILRNNFDNQLLEDVEILHTNLLEEDEKLGALKNEIAGMDKLLVMEIIENGTIIRQVDDHLKRLRKNIVNAEAEFAGLTMNFNNYFSENIAPNR